MTHIILTAEQAAKVREALDACVSLRSDNSKEEALALLDSAPKVAIALWQEPEEGCFISNNTKVWGSHMPHVPNYTIPLYAEVKP